MNLKQTILDCLCDLAGTFSVNEAPTIDPDTRHPILAVGDITIDDIDLDLLAEELANAIEPAMKVDP